MGVNENDNGQMVIYNEGGNIVTNMVADTNDNGAMAISDKDGNIVAGMVVVNKYGAISVMDKEGTLLAGMGANEYSGNGAIGVYNKSGKEIGSLP